LKDLSNDCRILSNIVTAQLYLYLLQEANEMPGLLRKTAKRSIAGGVAGASFVGGINLLVPDDTQRPSSDVVAETVVWALIGAFFTNLGAITYTLLFGSA
jgi:hypothetical protein